MSVVVIKIKKEENISLLKKYLRFLHEKAEVISDEEYKDSIFAELLKEGRKSKLLSPSQATKALRKYGINI